MNKIYVFLFSFQTKDLIKLSLLLGGNQREKAREKNQKKQAAAAKGSKESGTKLEERKHRFV